jgi:gluconate 2-dehydrogenase gamma chain
VTDAQLTRRGFLADTARLGTAGWLALNIPCLTALAGCARDEASKRGGFVALTPAEAKTMRAFAARIIPSDDRLPGADEAGAVYFVDRAFAMPLFAESVAGLRAGLADLDARARAAGAADFATLPSRHQVDIMREVEREPFFAAARTLVVIGTFADPSHGGNTHGAGWTLLGLEHRPSYSAPYGWYDAHADADSSKRAA